jgi:beta-phosphoglucomutase-like phosphatase (HAD superfamily)
LVIFDCDGVLVDSEPISNGVLAEMLAEQGWELTLGEARERFQGLLLAQVREVAEQQLGRALPPGWLEEYVRRRAAVFDAELQPVEGASELVRRVAGAGIPV